MTHLYLVVLAIADSLNCDDAGWPRISMYSDEIEALSENDARYTARELWSANPKPIGCSIVATYSQKLKSFS